MEAIASTGSIETQVVVRQARGGMFLGQYLRTIDEKGRLVIPPEFREALAGGAVMTRNFDTCLCIYPLGHWNSMAQAILDLPQVRPEVRDLARSVFGAASPCAPDRQGRITVPGYLREYANLRSDVAVVGVNEHLEIWNKSSWQRKQAAIHSEKVSEVFTAPGA